MSDDTNDEPYDLILGRELFGITYDAHGWAVQRPNVRGPSVREQLAIIEQEYQERRRLTNRKRAERRRRDA